jgi:two-component system, chemotaxis family, CheB/CheR fusion protein
LATDDLEAMLNQVARDRGIDFRDYRRETIERGIQTRMHLLGEATGSAYLRRLRAEKDEISELVQSLVVPWSGFFRNLPMWKALTDQVLPAITQVHLERTPLRAWCIGAATGEEVWSLAMLLRETCTGPGGPSFSLLATDLDRRALATAEAGSYPIENTRSIPPRYFERYLQSDGDRVQVRPILRDHVRFAYHDLVGKTLAPPEAVIASFEIAFARNVLIYFDRRLQEKALERIAAVLEPGAVLVLGPVETLPVSFHQRFFPFAGTPPQLRIFSYLGAE